MPRVTGPAGDPFVPATGTSGEAPTASAIRPATGEPARVRSIVRIPADGVYDTTCVSSKRREFGGGSRSSKGTCWRPPSALMTMRR